MKYSFALIGGLILFLSCETEPIININSVPITIVYAVFDDQDSLHTIRVGKSFGANYNPAVEAQMYDSILYDDIQLDVQVKGVGRWSSWESLEVEQLYGNDKDSGFFAYPKYAYFQFNKILRKGKIRFVDSLRLNVIVPNHDTITGQIQIIDSITISTPKFNQQYIFLVPRSPLRFHWDHSEPGMEPHPWNEVDIKFEFIEETKVGQRSKFVNIQNTQYFLSPNDLFREMSITYEEFIKEVQLQIPVDPDVIKTYLGHISAHITGSDENIVEYRKYLYGHSDYNNEGYSNIENGFGILSSVTHLFKDSMRFDGETKATLLNENRLKKYKLSR